jgi:hypothetical protein
MWLTTDQENSKRRKLRVGDATTKSVGFEDGVTEVVGIFDGSADVEGEVDTYT